MVDVKERKVGVEVEKLRVETLYLESQTQLQSKKVRAQAIENNVRILRVRKIPMDAQVPIEWIDTSLPLPEAAKVTVGTTTPTATSSIPEKPYCRAM